MVTNDLQYQCNAYLDKATQYNGHYNTIYCNCLTKNNAERNTEI